MFIKVHLHLFCTFTLLLHFRSEQLPWSSPQGTGSLYKWLDLRGYLPPIIEVLNQQIYVSITPLRSLFKRLPISRVFLGAFDFLTDFYRENLHYNPGPFTKLFPLLLLHIQIVIVSSLLTLLHFHNCKFEDSIYLPICFC